MKEGLTALSVYLQAFHLLKFSCLSESLGLTGHLSIINVHSAYTKAVDNKAKCLHIPISFPSGGAKYTLGVCVGEVCVNTANSATVPKGSNTALRFLILMQHFSRATKCSRTFHEQGKICELRILYSMFQA